MEIPTCVKCSCLFTKNSSTWLVCPCMVYFCQQCSLESISGEVNTFRNGIKCPVCNVRTNSSVIPAAVIKQADEYETELVQEAFDNFNQRIGSLREGSQTIENYIPIIKKFKQLDKCFEKFCNISDGISVDQIRLLIARLEILREASYNDEDDAFEEFSCLPPGPLQYISLLRHKSLEKFILDLLLYQHDLKLNKLHPKHFIMEETCMICDQCIVGQSVLYECECCINCCRTCELRQIATRQNVYADGIQCMICKRSSHYLKNVEEAKSFESDLVSSIMTLFHGQKRQKLNSIKDVLRKCDILCLSNAYKKNERGRREDDSDAMIHLELARVSYLRNELLKLGFVVESTTNPKIVRSKLAELKLAEEYLPLGPLDRIEIPRDMFKEYSIIWRKNNFSFREIPNFICKKLKPSELTPTDIELENAAIFGRTYSNLRSNDFTVNSPDDDFDDYDDEDDVDVDGNDEVIVDDDDDDDDDDVVEEDMDVEENDDDYMINQGDNIEPLQVEFDDIPSIEVDNIVETDADASSEDSIDINSRDNCNDEDSDHDIEIDSNNAFGKEYDNYADSSVTLRSLDNYLLFDIFENPITSISQCTVGFVIASLIPHVTALKPSIEIKVSFNEWMVYVPVKVSNKRCNFKSPMLAEGDIVIFDNSQGPTEIIYKLLNPHPDSKSKRLFSSFLYNYIPFVFAAEQSSLATNSDFLLCTASYEEVLEMISEDVNVDAFLRMKEIVYSQIVMSGVFCETCNLMTSLSNKSEKNIASSQSNLILSVPSIPSVPNETSSNLSQCLTSTESKSVTMSQGTLKSAEEITTSPLLSRISDESKLTPVYRIPKKSKILLDDDLPPAKRDSSINKDSSFQLQLNSYKSQSSSESANFKGSSIYHSVKDSVLPVSTTLHNESKNSIGFIVPSFNNFPPPPSPFVSLPPPPPHQLPSHITSFSDNDNVLNLRSTVCVQDITKQLNMVQPTMPHNTSSVKSLMTKKIRKVRFDNNLVTFESSTRPDTTKISEPYKVIRSILKLPNIETVDVDNTSNTKVNNYTSKIKNSGMENINTALDKVSPYYIKPYEFPSTVTSKITSVEPVLDGNLVLNSSSPSDNLSNLKKENKCEVSLTSETIDPKAKEYRDNSQNCTVAEDKSSMYHSKSLLELNSANMSMGESIASIANTKVVSVEKDELSKQKVVNIARKIELNRQKFRGFNFRQFGNFAIYVDTPVPALDVRKTYASPYTGPRSGNLFILVKVFLEPFDKISPSTLCDDKSKMHKLIITSLNVKLKGLKSLISEQLAINAEITTYKSFGKKSKYSQKDNSLVESTKLNQDISLFLYRVTNGSCIYLCPLRESIAVSLMDFSSDALSPFSSSRINEISNCSKEVIKDYRIVTTEDNFKDKADVREESSDKIHRESSYAEYSDDSSKTEISHDFTDESMEDEVNGDKAFDRESIQLSFGDQRQALRWLNRQKLSLFNYRQFGPFEIYLDTPIHHHIDKSTVVECSSGPMCFRVIVCLQPFCDVYKDLKIDKSKVYILNVSSLDVKLKDLKTHVMEQFAVDVDILPVCKSFGHFSIYKPSQGRALSKPSTLSPNLSLHMYKIRPNRYIYLCPKADVGIDLSQFSASFLSPFTVLLRNHTNAPKKEENKNDNVLACSDLANAPSNSDDLNPPLFVKKLDHFSLYLHISPRLANYRNFNICLMLHTFPQLPSSNCNLSDFPQISNLILLKKYHRFTVEISETASFHLLKCMLTQKFGFVPEITECCGMDGMKLDEWRGFNEYSISNNSTIYLCPLHYMPTNEIDMDYHTAVLTGGKSTSDIFKELDLNKFGSFALYFKCIKIESTMQNAEVSRVGNFISINVHLLQKSISSIQFDELSSGNHVSFPLTCISVNDPISKLKALLKDVHRFPSVIDSVYSTNLFKFNANESFKHYNICNNCVAYLCPSDVVSVANYKNSQQERNDNRKRPLVTTFASGNSKKIKENILDDNCKFESPSHYTSQPNNSISNYSNESMQTDSVCPTGDITDDYFNYFLDFEGELNCTGRSKPVLEENELGQPGGNSGLLKESESSSSCSFNLLKSNQNENLSNAYVNDNGLSHPNQQAEVNPMKIDFSVVCNDEEEEGEVRDILDRSDPFVSDDKSCALTSSSINGTPAALNVDFMYPRSFKMGVEDFKGVEVCDTENFEDSLDNKIVTIPSNEMASSSNTLVNLAQEINLNRQKFRSFNFKQFGDYGIYIDTPTPCIFSRNTYSIKYDGPRSGSGKLFLKVKVFLEPFEYISTRSLAESSSFYKLNLTRLNLKLKGLKNLISEQLGINANVSGFFSFGIASSHKSTPNIYRSPYALNPELSLFLYKVQSGDCIYLCPLKSGVGPDLSLFSPDDLSPFNLTSNFTRENLNPRIVESFQSFR